MPLPSPRDVRSSARRRDWIRPAIGLDYRLHENDLVFRSLRLPRGRCGVGATRPGGTLYPTGGRTTMETLVKHLLESKGHDLGSVEPDTPV